MYNPDKHSKTERDFPFQLPSGPTSSGECNLKYEWQIIGTEALKEANARGYDEFNHENYASLCQFIKQNRNQLYIEGILGGLSGKTLGAEIAFRKERRYKDPSITDLIQKGLIEVIDMGELK